MKTSAQEIKCMFGEETTTQDVRVSPVKDPSFESCYIFDVPKHYKTTREKIEKIFPRHMDATSWFHVVSIDFPRGRANIRFVGPGGYEYVIVGAIPGGYISRVAISKMKTKCRLRISRETDYELAIVVSVI